MIIQTYNNGAQSFAKGTVSELIAGGLKLNGQPVDTVTLSMLGKFGVINKVDSRKAAKGKPAAVYEVQLVNEPSVGSVSFSV
jgi:hypothetical protein